MFLEQDFSEEIVAALRSTSGDKAPGPDRFSMAFFQRCWEVIKDDIIEVFHFFHTNMQFGKSFNASFIVLIPKKKGATDIRDFRPINLIGGGYKLIAKVLLLRLRKVIGKFISKSQHAFVGEHQILDVSFTAKESVDARMRRCLLCKLDIEKAYDHVNCDFLMYIMNRLGFGDRWSKWIHFCVTSVYSHS